MAKPAERAYSKVTQEAAALLGQQIRMARLEQRMTADDLAERVGISRGLLQRIERGDLGCAIGAVFEAAAVLGIPLFGIDHRGLTDRLAANAHILTLLPKTARPVQRPVKDDF
ncbi:transcriptional regulator (plasmid) [Aureimonas sp. SA4125]|uniref:helix-turn-helix transcriptional regulator n=1 Tax=Aureimonas sp. SA4125 TaxID=2826993 RepID=UPI001CC4BD71|nr:helix-turn-helix transcriptional regulator [Aureimonas sp. SA4125]BDA87215.1 transcriptional regulator [Aureimonas sp. SA4125]